MIHFHFVAEVRNMKKHKLCGMISSVFSVENDTGVVDAFHRLADSVQADLSQREGMPKAWYFTITQFKEVGRDDATYRDAVQTEQHQPQLYEHSDGMMREHPETTQTVSAGTLSMHPELASETYNHDDLVRMFSSEGLTRVTPEHIEIKPPTLDQIARNQRALKERSKELSAVCDHEWISSEGRTASGFICRKCGDSDDWPEPCARCGKRSSRPDGEHYCHVSGDAERKKHIGDTQAPILNGSVTVSSAPLTWAPSGDTGSTGSPEESANAPYAKAVDQHYGGDTAADSPSSD